MTYLRNFFQEYKLHSALGYITIEDDVYKELDYLHRRAKVVKKVTENKEGFILGSLTLLRKKDEQKYHNIKFQNYLIIYVPINFRDTSIDPNEYTIYCGARKNKKYLKAVKIPIKTQFLLYFILQQEAQRLSIERRK